MFRDVDRMAAQIGDEDVYAVQRDPIGKIVENSLFDFLMEFNIPQGDEEYDQCADGLVDLEPGAPIYWYHHYAQRMKQEEKTLMYINYNHLAAFNHQDPKFHEYFSLQYYRYESDLRQGLTRFLRQTTFGEALDKRRRIYYSIAIFNLPNLTKIRELRSQQLGRLMAIAGTVTRTTDAKPELIMGTFLCLACQSIVQNVEQQFKYTEPVRCSNQSCENKKDWEMLNKESVMVDWQKLRLQEDSSDIPAGSMPRSIDVILRGDIVDQAKPGDKAHFCGKLVVVPAVLQLLKPGEKYTSQSVDISKMKRNEANSLDGVSGLNRLGAKDLSYRMVFIASCVSSSDSRFGINSAQENAQDVAHGDQDIDVSKMFSLQERSTVLNIREQENLYTKLAMSIAPNIHGHLDIKKGILLQLFGGIQKRTKEGIKLRGDINVCIVGDPATAKSQFLKYVCQFLPRAVYTSGKASSAAGLTASVLKDPETGDFCIEAGALMLADHGICCIDEFDKMDVKDQVAIHEAMEQQTISIAKAGIHATLNARASILAAANPIHGRYDRSRTLRYNTNISAPIMSRFDIFFLIFDDKNETEDELIAQHIVNMHRIKEEALKPEFKMEDVQTYIKFCRAINPQFSKESAQILKEEYKRIRRDQRSDSKNAYNVTVRQLESLIRLSEALARAHADDEIKPNYVREVCRLLRNSNVQIQKRDIEMEDNIQEDINRERRQELVEEKQKEMEGQVENQGTEASQSQKKVKISFEEYQKLSIDIVNVMKDFEMNEGKENVQQFEIINKMVQRLMLDQNDIFANESNAIELSKKISHVIQYLIQKEKVLMIVQDSKVKNERFLCLSVQGQDNMQI